MPKPAMETLLQRRINKEEHDCEKIVIEMRKLREKFREVVQALTDVRKRDEEAKKRGKEIKKMIENFREENIKLTDEQKPKKKIHN